MLMKPLLTALALTTALTAPELAAATPVTLTTTLNSYGGPGAYLAFYVTDKSGAYAGTVWMAGSRSKYYEHLTGWARASGGDTAGIAGITGASVGSGQSLTITLDLVDTVFDAGYTLHIDAAAENMRTVTNDVAVELTSAGLGQPVAGRGYISSFTYSK
jgi:hypothetical protein